MSLSKKKYLINGRIVTQAELKQAYEEVKRQNNSGGLGEFIGWLLILGAILFILGFDIEMVVFTIVTFFILVEIGGLVTRKMLNNCLKTKGG